MRLAQLGGLPHDPRELGEDAEQDALGLVGQQARIEGGALDPRSDGVLRDRPGAGVRVLHVVHRVVVGALAPQVQVDVDRGVEAAAHERVPSGVDAHRIHQVVDHDDRPRALRHAGGLAVAQQVHQLADQDLKVHVRLVAERGGHRHHAADVAVVVGAEDDDVPLEPALALVEVVGEVAREVQPARRSSAR